jgi:hypothetical protein
MMGKRFLLTTQPAAASLWGGLGGLIETIQKYV